MLQVHLRPHIFAMSTAESALLTPTAEPDTQRPRVALCEPDALLRALLEEWLLRAGFEPVRCAAASATTVALVVADVTAPRHGGAACIAGLRQRFPNAKVLAISAQFIPGMSGAGTAAVELGADAALAKPFAAQVFIDAVHALAAGRHISSVVKPPPC
jgi:DNA-binding NarL/FixJ family response regulator